MTTAVTRPAPVARAEQSAVDRLTRTMALALGPAAVLILVVALPGFMAQIEVPHPLWTWGVAAGLFLPPIAAAVASPFAPIPVLRALAGTGAVAELVGLALLIPALPGGHLDSAYGPSWLLLATAAGTTAGAVAFPAPVALVQLGLTSVLIGIDRFLAPPETTLLWAFEDALYSILFNGVFVALAIATARVGARLDRATAEAVRETRLAATAAARGRERSRVEALLHDSVLVALLASSRGSDRAPEQAQAALDELERLANPADEAPVASDAWVWRLQSLATDLAPDARFSQETDTVLTLPPAPARAMLEAAAEALRNSVQHAGPASRAVHVRTSPAGVDVSVLDDGAGFDPAAVRPGRLGVAVSILERMRTIPGGRARIASHPGVGTRIEIAWTAS